MSNQRMNEIKNPTGEKSLAVAAGAKAHDSYEVASARLKSCPDTKPDSSNGESVSQIREEHPSGAKAQASLFAAIGTTEVAPFQNVAVASSTTEVVHVQNAEPREAMNTGTDEAMTLEQVRGKLSGVKGKRYWRSIDELADTAEFQAAVEKEFPGSAQEWVDPVSRRGFMKLMYEAARRADLSLRQGARRSDSGQADVFCDCASVFDGRGAAAGEERSVQADQGGRQSRARL
jgi:MoCo/4Fe-4S cofactor protein with predicted Tat translocation signal